ncbi:MAG: hypothetical protein JOZ62_11780 [Acidobacteriaceae bacterium]|nr:hypothetical protein [Acidobacteriaceae bacterium]
MNRMLQKFQDYLSLGTRHVFVIDPKARTAFSYDAAGLHASSNITVGPHTVSLFELLD